MGLVEGLACGLLLVVCGAAGLTSAALWLMRGVADVRDDSKELKSDVIDLSEVRQRKR